MNLTEKLLHIAGKENFSIDERISKRYLAGLCWKYGWMMVRGKMLAMYNCTIDKTVFIGKSVKILERRYLTVGAKTKIHDGSYIDAMSQQGVIIGDHVVLGRNTRIECTGSLTYVGKGVMIGNRTTFGDDCYFGAAGGIRIGDDVVAGQYVRFHSENHNFDDLEKPIREQGVTHKGIKIGNNCWIGAGAVFLDGADIGDGCVVAANAVVTKKFPGNCVLGGVPAKIIRERGRHYNYFPNERDIIS